MTQSQDNDQIGDSKSPPLKPQETALRSGANQANALLAGFAKDATLPSDPRVVYLGGDEKYRYANLRRLDRDREIQYADAGGRTSTTVTDEGVAIGA